MSEPADGSPGGKPQPDPAPARRATDLPDNAPWWMKWFVANINEAWKWGSMWWPFLCGAVVEVYATLPEDQQQAIIMQLMDLIPKPWRPHVLAGTFAISMILRVMNLAKAKEQKPKGE